MVSFAAMPFFLAGSPLRQKRFVLPGRSGLAGQMEIADPPSPGFGAASCGLHGVLNWERAFVHFTILHSQFTIVLVGFGPRKSEFLLKW
jgi:hypothetical protein